MPLTIADLPTLMTLLEEAPAVRTRLRTMLDLNALDRVPDRLDRLERILERLMLAQERADTRMERSEGRLDRIEEIQQRTTEGLQQLEASLQRLEATVQALADSHKEGWQRLERLEASLQQLADSQIGLQRTVGEMAERRRGEEGRRAGEDYERQILRRAVSLFNLGDGGSPAADRVSTHLLNLLKGSTLVGILSPEQDPFLADVIWWKRDRYAIVEVSLQVDNNDVKRAARRAEILRDSGVDVIPVVIGEEWASLLSRKEAENLAVAWKVGNELSPGFIEYRKVAI